MRTASRQIALGGVLAALALVIMCMGGLIPVATYVCPMICAVILQFVLRICGSRIAWAWYGAVAILTLLMGPDKEAAAVFAFLGYYPIVKPKLDKIRGKWIWKGLLFNASVLVMYGILIRLFGMAELMAEFTELGTLMAAVMLLMGNVTFFLLDRVLEKFSRRK